MARSHRIRTYKQSYGHSYRRNNRRIYRRSIGGTILRWVLTIAVVALVLFLGWKLYQPVSDWLADITLPTFEWGEKSGTEEQPVSPEQNTEEPQTPAVTPPKAERPKEEIILEVMTPAKKTAYLSEEIMMDPALFEKAIADAKASGMDSIMFDLKDRDGWLIYAIEYKDGVDDYYTGHTIDLDAAVQQIKDAGLKPIASIYTFMDRRFQQAETYAGILYQGTESFWLDNALDAGGKSWLNPYSPMARDYICKLLDDAAEAGFEEIVLREFRFPIGYSMEMMEFVYDNGQSKQDCLKEADDLFREHAKQLGMELWIEYPAVAFGGDVRPYGGDALELLETQCVIDLSSMSDDEIASVLSVAKMQQPTADLAVLIDSEEQLEAVTAADIDHYILY